MKRLEPNLLLAIATGTATILVVLTATLYEAGQPWLRNVLLVVACVGGFVLLNPILMRIMRKGPGSPMIDPESHSTTAWASLFPVVVIACAAIPVFWPGHDYGLLVLAVAVWFGVTVESALKAR